MDPKPSSVLSILWNHLKLAIFNVHEMYYIQKKKKNQFLYQNLG